MNLDVKPYSFRFSSEVLIGIGPNACVPNALPDRPHKKPVEQASHRPECNPDTHQQEFHGPACCPAFGLIFLRILIHAVGTEEACMLGKQK